MLGTYTILPHKVQWSCSALSLTRIQLSGTNSLFLSVILPLSVLSNLSNLSLLKESFVIERAVDFITILEDDFLR